jgi:adenine-specific DNA methylase
MKVYKQSPLPFMGQKRKFLKQFKESLKKCPSDGTFVDLFGGSGLLSRTVKDYYPQSRVVYSSYKGNYWKLADYLDVLTMLNKQAYFYFTSNKSHIVELCKWMSTHTDYRNPFENAIFNTTQQHMNFNSSYTDIMVFKEYFS